MIDLPIEFELTDEEWENTPPRVRELMQFLQEKNTALENHVADLEAKLNKNSSNSNKPPSSDGPGDKSPSQSNSSQKQKEDTKRKRGGQKGHKGHKQELLTPTEQYQIHPQECSCGGTEFVDLGGYYTHQEIELPVIQMDIRHFVLHEGRCATCGQEHKAGVPQEHRTGYGPRLSALIAEVSGIQGNSRETVQSFCQSVLGFPISIGAIQNVLDRASMATAPHYEAIRDAAHEAEVNHVDETSWKNEDKPNSWLWVLCNSVVALFMVHPSRSKEAFEKLIGAWMGLLISDNYLVYQNWVGRRQKCLAHLIREAFGLSQHKDPDIARCGRWAKAELVRLIKMSKAPPTKGQWRAFFARLCHLISIYKDRKDKAGTFVRSLNKEMEALWLFLEEEGVEPTNNHAERMIRFAVLWRKRSQGTKSEKGNRWVERILSLRQTCRLHNRSSFEVLVDAMTCYFKDQSPDVSWIEDK